MHTTAQKYTFSIAQRIPPHDVCVFISFLLFGWQIVEQEKRKEMASQVPIHCSLKHYLFSKCIWFLVPHLWIVNKAKHQTPIVRFSFPNCILFKIGRIVFTLSPPKNFHFILSKFAWINSTNSTYSFSESKFVQVQSFSSFWLQRWIC